jgi:hypothetical protein
MRFCPENGRKQRTIGIGVGIGIAFGIGIGRERNDIDCDSDTDSDPECLDTGCAQFSYAWAHSGHERLLRRYILRG